MYDKEKIAVIIDDLNMYLEKLEKMNIKSADDLNDDMKFYASSMLIFSVLNRTIDLGDEIIKSKKLGYPLEIKEIFTILSENKVIKKEMGDKLKDLVVARNKLAHRYGGVKTKDVFYLIKEIKLVRNFVDILLNHIKTGR